jgi:hypothetical protein
MRCKNKNKGKMSSSRKTDYRKSCERAQWIISAKEESMDTKMEKVTKSTGEVQRMTQPPQQPPAPSSWGPFSPYEGPPAPAGPDIPVGRPDACSLLYLLISRTRFVNASSTLIRCLADVSMNLQPKCLARSRPSEASMRIGKIR